ncbi:MAG: polyprenyl glycosylphosphotransferase [Acidobacteria bacterium]|nr:MAG: polyprenyl glycosylphosphotransferase [Acidobacteriota bacterium]
MALNLSLLDPAPVFAISGFGLPERALAWIVIAWGLVASVPLVVSLRKLAYKLMSRRNPQRVLVIGNGLLADQVVAEIDARPHLRHHVIGIVDESPRPPRRRCLGSVQDLRRIVEQSRPDRVIVALGSRRGRMPLRALLDLRVRGILVEDGADLYERLAGKIAIEALTPTSVIFCKDFRPQRRDLALARALSQPLVAAALVALAPVLALVALAIKLDSGGPVFFVQERVGRGGKRFKLIKFCTMRPARGATSEWVRDNGDRLTRVGRWLRRFRLDELPQLVNILKGDMNLVGPRPHPLSNLPLFVLVMRNAPSCGEPIPYYALRWMVRPGLTGWAQVRYRYANDLEEEVEKMRHDLYYIKHMSPWLDLRILFETVRIVLLGREAAVAPPVAATRVAAAPPASTVTPPAQRVAVGSGDRLVAGAVALAAGRPSAGS